MATPIGPQEISSQGSRVSNKSVSSNKSFCSWGSRKPRDSLEKMRQRKMSASQTQQAPLRLLISVRNMSVQQEEIEEEEESSASSLEIFRPPINRGVVCDRYPKGKASLLVFILNIIISYAFGAAITGILNIFHVEHYGDMSPTEANVLGFLKLLFQRCVSRFFNPLAGFIADVYIGRCRMIHTALLSLFIGYAILIVSFLLVGLTSIQLSLIIGMQVIAFLFISAGGGAFEATIIPFGVDQLQGASSAEISSYFHFFYLGRNLGLVSGIFLYGTVSYLTKRITEHDYCSAQSDIWPRVTALCSVFQPLVTMCILTVGLVLNVCLSHWYFKNTLWENPVKLVAKILCYAATVKRHLPVHRRAFRYGEEKKSRIDLAKVEYDGKFSAEKVEDVKAFCRICLLMFTLIPTMFSLNAFGTFINYETNRTVAEWYPNHFLTTNLYPFIYYAMNTFFVLLSLPVINFCLIPFFPKLTIRARIGMGLGLYCAGNISVVVIHAAGLLIGHHAHVTKMQLWCLLLPIVIFAVAESLTVVSVLEFIYAQSPESMKGLLTGLYFLFLGLSSIFSSVVYFQFSESLKNRSLVIYYASFTIIQAFGLVFYVIVARLHKNRLRPDGDSFSNQQLIIEGQLK